MDLCKKHSTVRAEPVEAACPELVKGPHETLRQAQGERTRVTGVEHGSMAVHISHIPFVLSLSKPPALSLSKEACKSLLPFDRPFLSEVERLAALSRSSIRSLLDGCEYLMRKSSIVGLLQTCRATRITCRRALSMQPRPGCLAADRPRSSERLCFSQSKLAGSTRGLSTMANRAVRREPIGLPSVMPSQCR